ncbi:MAG: YegS/Rv2252/BmrU family lipid kinase, partial [Oscillospiraceae bacterium]
VSEPVRKFNEPRLSMPEKSTYINSGVMLMNLSLLRETQNVTEVLDYIDKYRKVLFLPDQDIMSSIYGGKILEIDSHIYNMTDREFLLSQINYKTDGLTLNWVKENSVIVHDCGKNKPWLRRYRGNLGVFYKKFAAKMPKMLLEEEKRERMLMLINPHSGQTTLKNKLLDIIDLFVKNNYEVTVRTTQYGGEIPQIIKNDSFDYDLLISCGGDGTLNESVTGIMNYNRDLLFGFIPAGTVNDFAASVHIPKNDMLAAAQSIIDGKEFDCDIGVFNDRYFTYIAAFGAFTAVSYETPQDFKNLLGRAAYILEGIASVPNIKSYHIKVTSPKSVFEDDFIFGMISNSISV